jgi:hypothetical protein
VNRGFKDPFRHSHKHEEQVSAPEGFFSKPIDREEFLDTVARILRV